MYYINKVKNKLSLSARSNKKICVFNPSLLFANPEMVSQMEFSTEALL